MRHGDELDVRRRATGFRQPLAIRDPAPLQIRRDVTHLGQLSSIEPLGKQGPDTTIPPAAKTPPDGIDRSVIEIARGVRDGTWSAREVLAAHEQRIHAADPHVHAFSRRTEALARARADAVDERRARGDVLGPLAGVPCGLKDLFVTAGVETTAGSRVLAGWVPPYEGSHAEALARADAVLCGKLALDEFAMGSSNENVAAEVPPVRNPWALDRVPGGSSGGSAAAVAAGMVPFALGTDTGGSIRQPASLCGVVGIKPTYGRVSRYGMIAFASSLDQAGPITRTVRDAALVLGVIAGHDRARLDIAAAAGARLARRVRGRGRGAAHRRAARGARTAGARCRRARGVQRSARRVRRRRAPSSSMWRFRTCDHAVAAYYVSRMAEACQQPRALRRRALRRARGRGDVGRDVRRDAQRRLRRGGAAPHPARDLRAAQGSYDAYYGRRSRCER